jgi:hypothetical protein
MKLEFLRERENSMNGTTEIELPLIALQMTLSIGGAWIGIRIVEDIRRIVTWMKSRHSEAA